jgi:palmitoyl transferase
MHFRQFAAGLGASLLLPASAGAFDLSTSLGDWTQQASTHLQSIYQQGDDDLYVSGYTWHDPGTYTEAKRSVLNNHGWGLGWGRDRVDDAGNDEMLYALVFSDSHYNAEPIVGYAKQWVWRPDGGAFDLGIGYTAGVTSRADIAKNIPFPLALPLASVGYGHLNLYGTLIPRFNGSPNNGNVAFFFSRYAF